jgi:glycosyltransferase involved in cell wall biosynthesis
MDHFPGRLGIQQRVLPVYRAVFFDELSAACEGGLAVFAGKPRADEAIPTIAGLANAQVVTGRNLHFFRVSSPWYFLWQAGLVNWLEAWDPDALIVEANPRYLSTHRAMRWMKTRGKPVIGWGLGAKPIINGSSPLTNMIRRALRNSRQRFLSSLDGVIAYSRRGAREYLEEGVPAERIFVATNAAVPRPTRPKPERQPHFVDQPKVLFVGRLQARKRVDNLLLACSRLPENIRPRLWIVGDGPEREKLHRMAQATYPAAEFPGALRGDDLEHYFSRADLFVLPGTGGLAVQEAMSFALPVIAAEGDGTQEDLVRPGNGWRIPPGDIEALESALKEALSDVGRLRKMGVESFRIVKDEANTQEMVRAFVKALNSIVSKPG